MGCLSGGSVTGFDIIIAGFEQCHCGGHLIDLAFPL